jgi:selenocysteine-specific elongation factor
MKHVVLGTAGHIDHGKTALVKALTGVDTDRLKVEKERGITTELGFTYLHLPSGIRLGIIDVPGHERFVKHMVAGVWGIDLVALIVAADEGVMPQTKEHLDICKLLQVKKGLVVLTKIDLVDADLLELVKEEVKEIVEGTFLEGAPILPVSSTTGEGIPELISMLDRLSKDAEERSPEGLFRLPVDRVFVMKGFGAVVTGTVVSGRVAVGETLEVLPSGLEGKVRNIQIYNEPAESAVAGQRAAVNLQGVETSAVERGDVLVRPGTLTPTKYLDVYLEYLPIAPRPLKHRTEQRFHIGTKVTMASIFLLDRDELLPGEGGFAQFRLERPVVALPRDRFVIRGSGLIQTLGGGVVLHTHPAKHKRHAQQVIDDLALLRDGSLDQAIGQHILRSGIAGVTFGDLLNQVTLSPDGIQSVLKRMIKEEAVLLFDPERTGVIDIREYRKLHELALAQLREFHRRFPMKSGLSKEELKTKLPGEMDPRLFQILIARLIQSNEVILEKDRLKLSGHQITSADVKGLVGRVEQTILKGGLQPSSPKELSEEWSEEEEKLVAVFEHLVHEGVLVKIRSGMYFHRTPFESLKGELIGYLKSYKEITTSKFKELTGASRKFTIPLIEYFDQIRVTLRVGEKRILRTTSSDH